MALIDTQHTNVISTLRDDASNRAKRASGEGVSKDNTPPDSASRDNGAEGRAVHDTITLSEGGHKVVNLGRGQALGEQIKNAPVDKNFADDLKNATDDVFRINKLFNQTLRSMFDWWK